MSCCTPDSSAYATGLAKLEAPKRNRYYFSKLMDVLQFDMEQSYFNHKRWMLNRLSLGSGVLCGLNVRTDNGKLCVAPGVAVDTFGHEIIVPGTFCLDPWMLPDECGKPTRELSRNEPHRVTLCLGYRECLADQSPVLVTDCRSEKICEAGSVIESFDLWVREGWPKRRPDLCEALSAKGGTKNGGYEVVATVDVGARPVAVAVAANGKRALIANEGAATSLQVLDLSTNTVVHTLSGAVVAPIGGMAIAPDGGRIYVTHAQGIVSVDIESDTPAVEPLSVQGSYGACTAIAQGKVLYAINVKKKIVERIDPASNSVKPVKNIKRPDDLAVSSDGALLFVADVTDNTVFCVATQNDTIVWSKPTDLDSQSLAASGAQAAAQAWSAATDKIRRFDATGNANDAACKADIRDSAFTTSGARYYVISRSAEGVADEVVVFTREDLKEIARLPLGALPTSIAIVPNRLRALITNAGSGTITIIDVPSLRERLCRVTLGACPEPDDEPCIPLATVELLADGTIGKLDVCAHRVRLLSNEALLELILCLAERMEECCGGKPSEPPPEDPPPPVTHLKVTRVEFLTLRGDDVLLQMQSPQETVEFSAGRIVNRVRLTFDRVIDMASIVTGGFADDPKTFSLLVSADWSGRPLNAVAGEVQQTAPNQIVYTVTPDPRFFQVGKYRLVLFGTADPSNTRPTVRANDGSMLDGEPLAFPSGDNVAGGDFVINFVAEE